MTTRHANRARLTSIVTCDTTLDSHTDTATCNGSVQTLIPVAKIEHQAHCVDVVLSEPLSFNMAWCKLGDSAGKQSSLPGGGNYNISSCSRVMHFRLGYGVFLRSMTAYHVLNAESPRPPRNLF